MKEVVLILLAIVTVVNALTCFKCKSVEDRGCALNHWHSTTATCGTDEKCYKRVIHGHGYTRVTRGCGKCNFDAEGSLVTDEETLKIYCCEKDRCNGAVIMTTSTLTTIAMSVIVKLLIC